MFTSLHISRELQGQFLSNVFLYLVFARYKCCPSPLSQGPPLLSAVTTKNMFAYLNGAASSIIGGAVRVTIGFIDIFAYILTVFVEAERGSGKR